MKRIKLSALVLDESGIDKKAFIYMLGAGAEIEKYEEKDILKDKDFFEEHSFDSLLDSAKDVMNGAWTCFKGLGGLAKYAVILIVSGLMMLGKYAFEGLKSKPASQMKKKKGG
jgi:hypothetical protein